MVKKKRISRRIRRLFSLRFSDRMGKKKEKIFDDNDYKYFAKVFDFFTLDKIRTLQVKGYIKKVKGVISEGKESVVILCNGPENDARILKIHKIETSDFKKMEKYIIGDPRFVNVKKKRRNLVYLWCRKEFSNLKKCFESKISVPKPYIFFDNLLVMECIVDKNGNIAKKIAEKEIKNPKEFLEKILRNLKNMYKKANIVHGDISEFNILNKDEYPVIIDLAQGVFKTHPLAKQFLRRDLKNLKRFFVKKYGVDLDVEKELKKILGEDYEL